MKQMNFPPTHTHTHTHTHTYTHTHSHTKKALHVSRPIDICGKKGMFLTMPRCKLEALS